jgi:hypothetical protein
MNTNVAGENVRSLAQGPTAILLPTSQGGTGIAQLLHHMLARMRRIYLFDVAFLHLFRTLQRCGISVLPNHYYWPIPDIRYLERRDWTPKTPSFDLKLAQQVRLASEMVSQYRDELNFASHSSPNSKAYHRNNGMFETVDADLAYCLVRHLKPARIVEIGGGHSTRLLAHALQMNQLRDDRFGELTTVEPYPDAVMRSGIPGLSRLLPCRIQEAPLDLIESLESGDILFIDSSHVVTVGSDVVYEFLEILPRVRTGVFVHLHDIFYPSDYPRDAVLQFLWFWSEQYLLELLLTSNTDFEVVWGSSAMQLYHSDVLEEAFPDWNDSYSRMPPKVRRFIPTQDYRRVWPSSFWMRCVGRSSASRLPVTNA